MPNGFDLNDFLEETDQQDPEASDLEVDESAVEALAEDEDEEESTESEDEINSYMDEVDARLEVASFYRALLKNPLFNGVRNKGSAATVVEKEVRAFCRSRLAVLMGLKPDGSANTAPVAISNQFTDEQAQALIAVANQLLAKNRTTPVPVVMPTTVAGPVVNTVPTGVKSVNKTQVKQKPSKKTPPKPLYEEKIAMDAQGNPVLNAKGEPIKIRNQRIQQPAGKVPFPTDVAMATQMRLTPSAGGGPLAALVGHHMKDE